MNIFWLLLAPILFTLMTAMDIAVASTITPRLIASLGDMHLYPIMSSVYLFSFVLAIPITGMCADYFGIRRSSAMALCIFALGSFLCGCSNTMAFFIFSRFVQGLGAASLSSLSFIIIGKTFVTDERRSLAQAIISSAWTCASIVGPLLGAFVTKEFSWRYIFFGYVFFSMLAWQVLRIKPLAEASSVRHKRGLLPLCLLQNSTVVMNVSLALISGACLTTASTLIPLYFQGALRRDVSHTGMMISAISVGWTLGSFSCRLLMNKISLHIVNVVALVLFALSFSSYCAFHADSALIYYLSSSVLLGFGMGLLVNSTNTGMMRIAPQEMLGRAVSFISLLRSVGMSLGASLSGFLQFSLLRDSISNAVQQEGMLATAGQALSIRPDKIFDPNFIATLPISELRELRQLIAESIEHVFFWPIGILLCLIPVVLLVSRRKEDLV